MQQTIACLPDRTWSCILFALSNAENASHRVVGPIRDANRCHACHNKESTHDSRGGHKSRSDDRKKLKIVFKHGDPKDARNMIFEIYERAHSEKGQP